MTVGKFRRCFQSPVCNLQSAICNPQSAICRLPTVDCRLLHKHTRRNTSANKRVIHHSVFFIHHSGSELFFCENEDIFFCVTSVLRMQHVPFSNIALSPTPPPFLHNNNTLPHLPPCLPYPLCPGRALWFILYRHHIHYNIRMAAHPGIPNDKYHPIPCRVMSLS